MRRRCPSRFCPPRYSTSMARSIRAALPACPAPRHLARAPPRHLFRATLTPRHFYRYHTAPPAACHLRCALCYVLAPRTLHHHHCNTTTRNTPLHRAHTIPYYRLHPPYTADDGLGIVRAHHRCVFQGEPLLRHYAHYQRRHLPRTPVPAQHHVAPASTITPPR